MRLLSLGVSMRRGAFIGIALLALSHFAFANVSSALAQAGSTGGTIGKQDKSISGGEETLKNNPAGKTLHKTATGSLCDKVAGTWTWAWLHNAAVVKLNPNGTSSATTGNTGTWTCDGRTVIVNWPLGPDALSISSNAKTLTGKGIGGIDVIGTRISGP